MYFLLTEGKTLIIKRTMTGFIVMLALPRLSGREPVMCQSRAWMWLRAEMFFLLFLHLLFPFRSFLLFLSPLFLLLCATLLKWLPFFFFFLPPSFTFVAYNRFWGNKRLEYLFHSHFINNTGSFLSIPPGNEKHCRRTFVTVEWWIHDDLAA